MLQEADYGLTEQAHGMAPGDETLFVKFFIKPTEDHQASQEQGRPIFKDTVYIEIRVPGQIDGVCRPVRERDKERFPRHWAAWEARQQEVLEEGTPLEEWPEVNRSLVEELKFFNVRTIEQLVNMSDANASKFMGINSLRQKAQEYLDAAALNADNKKLAAANKKIDQLEAKLEQALERLAALEPEETEEED